MVRYRYDGRNQLKKVIRNDSETQYEYDKNGNLVQIITPSGSETFSYDVLNRLIRYQCPEGVEETLYHGILGQRWHSSVQKPSEPKMDTWYVTNGDNVVADLTESVGGRHNIARSYISPFLDENISFTDYRDGRTSTYYYNNDVQGSVLGILDSQGNSAASYEYSAFGNLLSHSGLEQRYGFMGRERHQLGTAIHYRYRTYHPALGRFSTMDPLGQYANQWGNLYAYVGNMPTMGFDPYGLNDLGWWWERTKALVILSGQDTWEMVTTPAILKRRATAAAEGVAVVMMEPFNIASDLVVDQYYYIAQFTSDMRFNHMTYSSALFNGYQQRVLRQNKSGLVAAAYSVHDLAEFMLSFGAIPHAKKMADAKNRYEAGEISREELEIELWRTVGSQVFLTGLVANHSYQTKVDAGAVRTLQPCDAMPVPQPSPPKLMETFWQQIFSRKRNNAPNELNPLARARADQVKGDYLSDAWALEHLKVGDIVFGGRPGQSNYYTTLQTYLESGGSKGKLWRGLQVRPHPDRGFRDSLGIYRVNRDITVPAGRTRANPNLGPGGAKQLFIEEWAEVLDHTGTVWLGD